LVQSQLIPQKSGHPAGAPLTRPAQPHGAQPDRHHVAIENRRKTILGKQRDLFGLPGAFIEDLDRLAPRRSLAVVDLSEIKHLPLNHAAVMNAPVFDNRPCAMFLAVLAANLGAQKHDADSRLAHGRARSLVGTTSVCADPAYANSMTCRDQTPRKSQKSCPVGEVGLARSFRLAPLTGEKAIDAGSRISLAGLESLLSKAMRAARNWHSLAPRARPKAQRVRWALFRNFAPDPLRPGRDFQAGEALPGRRDLGTDRRHRCAGLS